MTATKQLYEFVKTLVTQIPTNPAEPFGDPNFVAFIKCFDWWNNNILDDGEQTPFPTPAVFFELNTILWEPSTAGTAKNQSSLTPEQVGNGEFTLHIVHKKIDSSAIDASELTHIDEVELVFRAVHFAGGVSYLEGPIQRVRDEQVLAHTVLRDWPLAFSFRLFECPAADPDIQEVDPWTDNVTIEAESPALPGPNTGIQIQLNQGM